MKWGESSVRTHILIEKAFVYPIRKNDAGIRGYEYDEQRGFWVSLANGEPLVSDRKRPKPITKKHDVETGEDMKGE